MPAHRPLVPALAATLLLLLFAAPASAQPPAACDPTGTAPAFRGEVPSAQQVIGFELGARDVTTAESDAYLDAVDQASPRVVSGTLARSVEGRPLRYAIVGRPELLTPTGLAAVRLAARALQNPRTPARVAAEIARRAPAILWVAGNVHGNEESGTDASLRVLHELADRSDCAAERILRNAVVVILPTQNPDGREADTRRNAYGFDMNRDWFARTQPETDGKVEMLRRYPPVLFVDAHEMGRATYFFPPNADPVYHEITDESVTWINELYGGAMSAEFNRRGIPFFNRDVYDLFYMGYGDTVPSTGFIAAGMTLEKANGDPAPQRTYEQYLTQWVNLSTAAATKPDILRRWHGAWVEAERQGVAGRLEPNEIVNPGSTVITKVPTDPVRHYFVRDDDPARSREVQELVRRLQRMDVRVRRLAAPLRVPDFRPHGRPARSVTLPAGTYWIPMAQRQKHWVQAMMNEDTYTPFPYFYDVTAWSQPLLFNVAAGFSGAQLEPRSEGVSTLPRPERASLPADAPSVAILSLGPEGSSIESSGWLRWLLDQWGLPHRTVNAADVAAGGLGDAEVLLAPNGSAATADAALGQPGRAALDAWVRAGGRYIGWRGGTELAARLGLTGATLSEPTSDVPGSLFRVAVDPASPLAEGVGRFAWAFYAYDRVMRAPAKARVPVAFPAANGADWFVSGFADREEELGRTAAVVDERVGAGRTVVFSFEPNFRGFTDGTQKLLRNAILGADPPAAATASRARRARSSAAARRLPATGAALRLTVRSRSSARAARLLDSFGARYGVARSAGRVRFVIANPDGLNADEHPYARDLGAALARAGVEVLAYSVP